MKILLDCLFLISGVLIGYGIGKRIYHKPLLSNDLEKEVRDTLNEIDRVTVSIVVDNFKAMQELDRVRHSTDALQYSMFGIPYPEYSVSRQSIIEMVEKEWRQFINLGRPDPVLQVSFDTGEPGGNVFHTSDRRSPFNMYQDPACEPTEPRQLYSDLNPDDFDHE